MYLSLLFSTFFIILNIKCPSVCGETGCPHTEEIAPCKCKDEQTISLICKDLESDFDFNRIIQNSKRYTYQEVHFESSKIFYIPRTLFTNIDIKELYLNNMLLSTLFDYPPEGISSLYKLHINNTVILRSLVWDLLKNFPKLKEISVNNMKVILSRSLSEKLPESVTHLTFYNAKIKKIVPGTLKKAANLDKFAVESCNLNHLSRDIFPKPFNGRILTFNDNNISTIDEDLFTDMPHLQFLSMKNNQISAIPESAFKGRTQNVPYFDFQGNPLICDCKLKWLINDKPEILRGTCSAPEQLSGRQLESLNPHEMQC